MTASPISSERMIEPELLITGEAVALDITPATVANRITSGLIDYGVYALGTGVSVLVVMALAVADGSELEDNLAFLQAVLSLVALAWLVVIPLLVEFLSGGRSLGRIVTGARVVRDDGGTVRLRHCLVRTLLAVVEIWGTWAVPALCASVVSKRGKRLGDMLAGTYVVREHHRSQTAPPLLMPPELTEWAAGTDLRALPGDLSLTARTFLQRASSLMPASRRHAPRTVPRSGPHRAAQPGAGAGEPRPPTGGGRAPRHGSSSLRGGPGGPTALKPPPHTWDGSSGLERGAPPHPSGSGSGAHTRRASWTRRIGTPSRTG